MSNAVAVVKRAALEAVQASAPCGIFFGTVISVKPLKIQCEQKLVLDAVALALTSAVSDYEVDMTVNGTTNTYKVKLGLKVGEKVILLRAQGGQQFVVLDRVR